MITCDMEKKDCEVKFYNHFSLKQSFPDRHTKNNIQFHSFGFLKKNLFLILSVCARVCMCTFGVAGGY